SPSRLRDDQRVANVWTYDVAGPSNASTLASRSREATHAAPLPVAGASTTTDVASPVGANVTFARTAFPRGVLHSEIFGASASSAARAASRLKSLGGGGAVGDSTGALVGAAPGAAEATPSSVNDAARGAGAC